MMRRLILFVILAVFLAKCTEKKEAARNDSRPNILFIFTDDHALQAISAYGSVINKTPHIDRLAEEGMIFQNAFCTNSICAPSRAVIQTGKHSHLNGVLDNRMVFDSAQTTFPKLFGRGGYQTAMIGKWHLKSEPVGFDFWKVLPGQGSYYNPDFRTPSGLERIEGYVTDVITDVTLEWLETIRDKTKPFMLMTQHKAPHRAWLPGPRHLNMYDSVTIPEPATLFDDYSGRASGAAVQEMEIDRHMRFSWDLKVVDGPADTLGAKVWDQRKKRFTSDQLEAWNKAYEAKNKAFLEAGLEERDLVRWKYQRYIKDYLRCVASVDDNIGRLLKYLDESGLAENTVVIYSSDQGFYLGEHGWFDKRWMYEESLHMPFIVKWPGVTKPGSVNADMVQNLDFAETFLEMAGLKIPKEMQGQSLVPLLKGKTPENWRKSIYYHYYEFPGAHSVPRHNGVRTERYKLINYYELGEKELFDLKLDRQEMKNVYNDPEYTEIQTRMEQELARLKSVYRDNTIQ
ncbi:MAG: sulfatase [Cytophagales bacterium]|nr:sulfatase [Cytophagales bacterium]